MQFVKPQPKSKTRRKRVETPFAQNLRKLFAERGISIRAAAELAQVSSSVISAWVTGSSPHDFTAVQRLANALQINFELLLTGKTSQIAHQEISLTELFTEEATPLSGLFRISATRLVRRSDK